MVTLMVAVVTLALSLFFKVSKIEVSGMEVCGAREIIEASGIEEGDFLLLVNSVAAGRGIKAALPYIDTVSISRSLPGAVMISVTETTPLVRVPSEHREAWLVDHRGKLLGKADDGDSGDSALPGVTGVTLLAPVEGTLIEFGAEQRQKGPMLLDVLEAVREAGLLGGIRDFDIGDAANIKFSYMDRFTVYLGVPNDLPQKLAYIPYVLAETLPNERGVIDLSGISGDPARKPLNQARFIPE